MTASQYKNSLIELEKKGDFRGAYEVLREAILEYPANPFFIKAEIYILFKLGGFEEARLKAEVRVEQFKYDTFFLRTYLNILAGIKNSKKDAEDLVDKILTWGIKDEAFLAFLTQLAGRISGSKKAHDVLMRSLSLVPGSTVLKKMLDEEGDNGFESKFRFYKKKFGAKNTPEAINEIEIIMGLPEYARDYELNLYLAGLYKESGQLDKSIDIYKRLLTIKEREFTRKMLGYAYYKKGEPANALVYLKDIFLNYPFDHYLYTTIFKIFKILGDKEGIKNLFREALASYPSAKHLYGLIKKADEWQKK